MPSIRSVLLYGLSICSLCKSNEKPGDESERNLDEVVRWLPEESVKAALRDNLAPKYREGVFEHHHKAIEVIKGADPELAAKVVDEALQKEMLLKRQVDNSTTTSNPPDTTSDPPSDPTSDPPSDPTPSSNPPSNPTSDEPSNPTTSDEPSNPTTTTQDSDTQTTTQDSDPQTTTQESNPQTTTPDSNTQNNQNTQNTQNNQNTQTNQNTQSPAGEYELLNSQAPIARFGRSTVVDDEFARLREEIPGSTESTWSSNLTGAIAAFGDDPTTYCVVWDTSSIPRDESLWEEYDNFFLSNGLTIRPTNFVLLRKCHAEGDAAVPLPSHLSILSSHSADQPTSSSPPETQTGVIIPVTLTTTDDNGQTTTRTTSAFQTSADTSTVVEQTTTNAAGSTITTKATVPAQRVTTTNNRGETVTTLSTLSTAHVVNGGSVVSAYTTTDKAGNSVVLSGTSSGQVITTTDSAGKTVVMTYTPGGGAVSELVQKTTTLPNGDRKTLTSFAVVGKPTAGAEQTKGDPELQNGAVPTGRYVGEMAAIFGGAVGLAAML